MSSEFLVFFLFFFFKIYKLLHCLWINNSLENNFRFMYTLETALAEFYKKTSPFFFYTVALKLYILSRISHSGFSEKSCFCLFFSYKKLVLKLSINWSFINISSQCSLLIWAEIDLRVVYNLNRSRTPAYFVLYCLISTVSAVKFNPDLKNLKIQVYQHIVKEDFTQIFLSFKYSL